MLFTFANHVDRTGDLRCAHALKKQVLTQFNFSLPYVIRLGKITWLGETINAFLNLQWEYPENSLLKDKNKVLLKCMKFCCFWSSTRVGLSLCNLKRKFSFNFGFCANSCFCQLGSLLTAKHRHFKEVSFRSDNNRRWHESPVGGKTLNHGTEGDKLRL